ncbi:hypothetical protein TWF718_009817 [Orbilia javanica]|uniref:F-box domain-containing protein n=1 Tax=Orbilia javanica TaxID=47235 RepID=A0AAN8RBR1_9PEZI
MQLVNFSKKGSRKTKRFARRIIRTWASKVKIPQFLRPQPQRPTEGPQLLSLPLDILFEILEQCDLISFIRLLSTCQELYTLWGSASTIACLLKVLKRGMSIQAWLLYRALRARRWESVRMQKIHALQRSDPDRDIVNGDLPRTFQIDFGSVLNISGSNWPNAQTVLNEYPRTIIYGFGYIDIYENRYTVMEDIFYLRKFAEYWVEQYKKDACRLPVYHPRVLHVLILKDPERIYNAFYSHWLSELISIQEEELSNPSENIDFYLLPHAGSWLQAVKDCQSQWRMNDAIFHRFEREMNYLVEKELEKIRASSCDSCKKKRCECSRKSIVTKRRFAPFINMDGSGHYHKDKQFWKSYSKKFPEVPDSVDTAENLTLPVDAHALAYLQHAAKANMS